MTLDQILPHCHLLEYLVLHLVSYFRFAVKVEVLGLLWWK
jgi:hypothetical protein